MTRRRRASLAAVVRQALLLAMACFAPWAFGAVDAWAELVLAVVLVAVALLGVVGGGEGEGEGNGEGARGGVSLRARLTCAPSLALAGLVLLALVQSTPMPAGLLKVVAPGTARLRAALVPSAPERLVGEAGPVAPPPPTIGRQPGASFDAATRLAAAWLVLQAVLSAGGGHRAYRRFALVGVVNATLVALFAVIQALTWNGKIYWTFPSPQDLYWMSGGPFICHSHLAEYLNLNLGLAVGAMVGVFRARGWGRGEGRGSRSWVVYAVAVLIVGVLVSNSRGGVVAAVATGLVFGLMGRSLSRRGSSSGRPSTDREQRLALALGGAATVGTIGLLLMSLGDAFPYMERIATLLNPADEGVVVRLEVWRSALQAWRSAPLWGLGLGGFALAVQPSFWMRDPHAFVYAESEYVNMLAEGGLVGLGLLLLMMVGTIRLAARAVWAAASADRWLVLGGLAGGTAVLVQVVGDFGLHVAGVALTALLLMGHLCRLGLEAGAERPSTGGGSRARGAELVVGLACCGLAVGIAARAFDLARAESFLVAADVPLPATVGLTPERNPVPRETLEPMRDGLERALRLRPDWAEGHARLGLAHLSLYEQEVLELVRETSPEISALESVELADPLHLLDLAHPPGGGPGIDAATLAEQGPVQAHLLPAVRAFLEARRCCLVLALAHAQTASLHYLLAAGDPGPDYARRALDLAGDFPTLMFTARVAVRLGDDALAARCWRKALEHFGPNWAEVADAAQTCLPPDRILAEVVPSGGRHLIDFAQRLYARPESREDRERFLREAIVRLPRDPSLEPPERLWLEGLARAHLDDRRRARTLMDEALKALPFRSEWRAELVRWLLAWDLTREAHRQALVGLNMAPDDPSLKLMLQAAVDAIARGKTGTGTGTGTGTAP